MKSKLHTRQQPTGFARRVCRILLYLLRGIIYFAAINSIIYKNVPSISEERLKLSDSTKEMRKWHLKYKIQHLLITTITRNIDQPSRGRKRFLDYKWDGLKIIFNSKSFRNRINATWCKNIQPQKIIPNDASQTNDEQPVIKVISAGENWQHNYLEHLKKSHLLQATFHLQIRNHKFQCFILLLKIHCFVLTCTFTINLRLSF